MVFLEVNDVIKVYESEKKVPVSALRGIHLQVEKSTLVSIYGPSGSGKSTLLNVIAGIDKPTAGDVTIEPFGNIASFSKSELNKFHLNSIGVLNQFSRKNLIYEWTAKENLLFPLKLSGKLSSQECYNKVEELLQDVGLENRREFKVSDLSGGEAQRLGLAVALVNDPDLLLADEPTGEIDSANAEMLVNLFKKIIKTRGTTIVTVTHDLIVANSSDVAWNIKDGRIIGLHKSFDEEASINSQHRKYYISVDDHGNLRLPEDLRRKAGIKTSVTVEYNEKTKKLEISTEE